jgi:hypothetical protein
LPVEPLTDHPKNIRSKLFDDFSGGLIGAGSGLSQQLIDLLEVFRHCQLPVADFFPAGTGKALAITKQLSHRSKGKTLGAPTIGLAVRGGLVLPKELNALFDSRLE